MSLKQCIKTYLENEARARLRRNRYRVVANLIMEEMGLPQSKESLIEALHMAESVNRLIRMTQQTYPELADPTDRPDTKEVLEQTAQITLGYQSGFHDGVRELKKL